MKLKDNSINIILKVGDEEWGGFLKMTPLIAEKAEKEKVLKQWELLLWGLIEKYKEKK